MSTGSKLIDPSNGVTIIDFICRVLSEAEQFTTGRFNDTALFSGDNPHCRNAVTISQEALLREYLLFSQL